MKYLNFLLSQFFFFFYSNQNVFMFIKCEAIQLKVRVGAIVHHHTKLISKECSLIC